MLGFLNGLRRGLTKEGITLIGIVLGALLVQIWVPIWSPILARRTDLSLVTTLWLLALLVFLGTALLSGYGGSLLLRPSMLRSRERIAGALLGLLNVGLLLAFALRYTQRWFFGEASGRQPVTSWIRQDPLSRFLLDWAGVVLLCLALALALAGLITGLVRLVRRLRRPPLVTPVTTPEMTQPTGSASQPPVGGAANASEPSNQPPTIPIGQREKFLDRPPKNDQS
jgi:hypothetical protein